MSAELLKRAAEALRRLGESASPGPWAPDDPWLSDVVSAGEPKQHIADCSVGSGYRHGSIPDSAYIALMHPPVALALADWLEDEAFICERENAVHLYAAKVARAILREVA